MIYLSKLAKRLALAGPHAGLALFVLVVAGACASPDEREFLSPNPSQPVPIISLSVEPKIGTAKPGEVIQFNATARNAKGAAVVAEVDWSATGGTISTTGTFASDTYGQFQVTARLRSNALIADSAKVGVFVNPKDVLKLAVTPDGTEVTEGEGVQLEATAELADGSIVLQPALSWSADVGQVDGGGYFIAPENEGTYLVAARASSGVTATANVVVKPNRRNLERVQVAPGSVTLSTGQTQQFSVIGIWEDGYTKVISAAWSSTGGTIGGDGLFTAGGVAGNFRVIARHKQGTQTDTAFVSITEPAIVGLTVTPGSTSLVVGATQQYTATARLSDGTTKVVGATWEATGGSISAAGLYSAATAGSWLVKARVAGTTLAGEAQVNVSAPVATLTAITLNPSSATVPVGTTRQFSVTGTYSDGAIRTPSVAWSATGGTISGSGSYTAGTTLGTFRVIALSGDKADTSVITVSPEELTSLSISPATVSLPPGATQQFSASGTWSSGSSLTPIVSWTAEGGTITTAGSYTAGTTSGTYRVIGAHSGGQADTSLVTISPPAPTLVSLSLTPSSVSLTPGGTRQFSVSGSWTNGGSEVPPVTYTATGGTVTAGGLYSAGSTTGTFRVIAKHSGGTLADTSSVVISASAPTLQSITVSPATTSLQTGGSRQFTVTAAWSDGSSAAPGVTWSATSGTISSSGLYLAPSAAGTYKVIVKETAGTKADTAIVTVTAPVVVTDLTVTPGSKSLSTGATQQFTASATYSNGGTGTPSLVWSATGGTINASGLYTASNSAGDYRVIAQASGTTVKDTATVSLTAPLPPPPPPPSSGDILFVDNFASGQRAPAQNGVSWGVANVKVDDKIAVLPDAGAPSGYSLAFTYKGSSDITDDGWAEQRFKVPQLREIFLCMEIASPSNYFHRDASPNNNKLLRLWDTDYSNSTVHVGMSTLSKSNTGPSQVIVEYRQAGKTGAGNWNTGPWSTVFEPVTVDTIGFYSKVATSETVKDGIIKVWLNNKLVYSQTALGLMTAGMPGGNWFENGYLFGWANSGFTETTVIRLRRFLVAKVPVQC